MIRNFSATDIETNEAFNISITPEKAQDSSSFNPIMNEIRVQTLFPSEHYTALMQGKLDASTYVQAAINQSWRWVMQQYEGFEPEEGINYPSFKGDKLAWPRSESATAIPVILPPCTLRIEETIRMPQCIPLLGAGHGQVFDGSKLAFRYGSSLSVYGNLQSEHGPFQGIMGSIAGIKFVPQNQAAIYLAGDLSNFKIRNCHFSSVGLRHFAMIQHANRSGTITEFGEVLVTPRGGHTLKEVTFANNQFEGGSAAISISGGLNVNITNNTILYANLGMEIRNCHKVRITDNNVLGTKEGEVIQVDGQAGIIAGGSDISVQGNQFLDLDLGCAIAGKDNHVYLNDWSRTRLGNSGSSALIKPNWKCPKDFGPIKEGDRAPFAG